MIQHLRPKNREEWLAMRRSVVTASSVGALLGIHPYTTYFELYNEKLGRLPPDDGADDNGAMLWGQLLESVGVEMLQRTKPEWRITPNIIGDERGVFLKDADNRLGATPDALILDQDGRPGVAQIKSVEPSVFRREWMQDGDEPTPPLWIAAQVILEAYLARAKFAVVVPVRVGHRIDIDVIEVPLHEEVIERILRETAEFWDRIANMRPPQPDYRRDGELLARMLGPEDGTSVSLAHDNEFVDALGMRESLKQRLKETQEDLGYYETLIKDRIGPHSTATTADHVVTLKTQHRKSYTVAANSFRVMRVKAIGGR